jgi:hypothetical protein
MPTSGYHLTPPLDQGLFRRRRRHAGNLLHNQNLRMPLPGRQVAGMPLNAGLDKG